MNEETKKTKLEGVQAPKYMIMKASNQAGKYEKTTKALAEYVGMEHGYDMWMLVSQFIETDFKAPKLPDKATEQEKLVWGKEYDLHLKKKDWYLNQKAKVFVIILGHCDEPMKNTLETTIGYMEANRRRDVISLLRMIKAAAHGAVDKMYPPKQVVLALKHMCNAAQMEKEPLSAYYNWFQSLVERAENVYGELKPVVLAEKDPTYGSSKDQKKIVSGERGKC